MIILQARVYAANLCAYFLAGAATEALIVGRRDTALLFGVTGLLIAIVGLWEDRR